MRWSFLALLLACQPPAAPAAAPPTPALADPPGRPFFAPAVPVGRVPVRLAAVVPGARLVTFGFPFPRGSLDGLETVRVLSGGEELPAHVSVMARWPGTSSVRWARIQLEAAGELEVDWGSAPRRRDVAARVPARAGWRDGEPEVYAVLPADWLARGMLTGRQARPFAPDIVEARDDPARLPPHDGFRLQDLAAKNFFYTVIGEDDPRVAADQRCPFTSAHEPWLYDRAAAIFALYARSGFPRALREGVRAAELYRTLLDADGHFTLKSGRGGNLTMYSVAEGLAYLHWLTGDDEPLAAIRAVLRAHGPAVRWSPAARGWTERQHGLRLLAAVVAHEVAGDAESLRVVRDQLDAFLWHQAGAGGAVPRGIAGGLWHYLDQHEGTGDRIWVASPWMSALVADAATRAYVVTGDPRIASLVVGLARFAGRRGLVDYLTGLDGQPVPDLPGPSADHALEVAAMVAWGSWFAEARGTPDPALAARARALYASWASWILDWVRPEAPKSGKSAFRLPPETCRRYAWEHRPSGSLSWLLE